MELDYSHRFSSEVAEIATLECVLSQARLGVWSLRLTHRTTCTSEHERAEEWMVLRDQLFVARSVPLSGGGEGAASREVAVPGYSHREEVRLALFGNRQHVGGGGGGGLLSITWY